MENTSISMELESFMPCRFSPKPFRISEEDADSYRRLGSALLAFYAAQNELYIDSTLGRAPSWLAKYLDNGKPEEIIEVSRAKALRHDLPAIIRPDILTLENGFSVCELDSVPGGFGLAARMAECYQRFGHNVLSDVSIEEGFFQSICHRNTNEDTCVVIVVSDESNDYRVELEWLSSSLRRIGYEVYVAHPRDLSYTDEYIQITTDKGLVKPDVVYRFMEMFDYQQISKWNLLMYLAQGKRIRLTPPPKPYLEEKLWFAMFHHPILEMYWRTKLSNTHWELLKSVIPSTWLMDSTPIPPHSVIPGLMVDGEPVQSWDAMRNLSKRERRMVIKPSGFSPEAWGARGVTIGHDVNRKEWESAITHALEGYPESTSIIQQYTSPSSVKMTAAVAQDGWSEDLEGRMRVTPYYFVIDGEAIMSNVMVTLCSKEKKKIHGMRDAVMSVCSI